jgi:hypothetical protein
VDVERDLMRRPLKRGHDTGNMMSQLMSQL